MLLWLRKAAIGLEIHGHHPLTYRIVLLDLEEEAMYQVHHVGSLLCLDDELLIILSNEVNNMAV